MSITRRIVRISAIAAAAGLLASVGTVEVASGASATTRTATLPTYLDTIIGPGQAAMYPVDVAATASDYYVADPGRYQIDDVSRSTGQLVASIGGTRGSGPGQFGAMRALTVDDQGNIYVADTPNFRIEKFSPSLQLIITWGGRGTGPGQFSQGAYGVAAGPGLGPNGQAEEVVYAVDGGGKLMKFDTSGNYISTVTTTLQRPRQAVVNPVDGDVYVANDKAHQVVSYNEQGALRLTFGKSGSGPGQFTDDMRGLAITPDGSEVLVTDAGDYRLEAFSTTDGTYLWQVGTKGTAPGQFGAPRGIAIASDGTLVVSDQWGYGLDIFALNSTTAPTGATFETKLFGTPAPVPGVDSPRGMAVDPTGRLYVDDWWNQRAERVNSDGTGAIAWGARGIYQSVGAFDFAWDVARQPGTGNIFVANRESNQVLVFDADGNYVATIGSRGTGNGQFHFPQGVAFDPTNGDLLVADSANNRIQRFSLSSGEVATWVATYGTVTAGGAPGQFNYPTGIDVGPDGTLWVADGNNSRVQEMNPTSGSWTPFSTIGSAGHLTRPLGVTVAPDGTIWIADTGNNRIVTMSAGGQLDFAATGQQMGSGALNAPFQVAFNPVNGHAYISDTFNNRVIEVNP